MNKCESCVYARWERDEFFGFWYVAGCLAMKKTRPFPKLKTDICDRYDSLDIDQLEMVGELLDERRTI